MWKLKEFEDLLLFCKILNYSLIVIFCYEIKSLYYLKVFYEIY
jgi:hypothetical protein